MKRKLVLDNSVIVKWFHRENEENVGQAEEMLRAVEAGIIALIEPTLLRVELANSLLVGKKMLIEGVIGSLSLCEDLAGWVEMDLKLARRAVEMSQKYGITVYDALYAAVAEEVGGVLVSDDQKHHGKIKGVKMLGEWRE